MNSNWAFVTVFDLATGATNAASPDHGFSPESLNMTGEPFNAVTVSWSPNGNVVVLGRTPDGQIIVTEHAAQDLRTELR